VAEVSWRGEVVSFASHTIPDPEERAELERAEAAALGDRLAWRAKRNADSYHAEGGKRVRTFEGKDLFAAMRAAVEGEPR
jgi:hypothetical protein